MSNVTMLQPCFISVELIGEDRKENGDQPLLRQSPSFFYACVATTGIEPVFHA